MNSSRQRSRDASRFMSLIVFILSAGIVLAGPLPLATSQFPDSENAEDSHRVILDPLEKSAIERTRYYVERMNLVFSDEALVEYFVWVYKNISKAERDEIGFRVFMAIELHSHLRDFYGVDLFNYQLVNGPPRTPEAILLCWAEKDIYGFISQKAKDTLERCQPSIEAFIGDYNWKQLTRVK